MTSRRRALLASALVALTTVASCSSDQSASSPAPSAPAHDEVGELPTSIPGPASGDGEVLIDISTDDACTSDGVRTTIDYVAPEATAVEVIVDGEQVADQSLAAPVGSVELVVACGSDVAHTVVVVGLTPSGQSFGSKAWRGFAGPPG